MHLIDSIVRAQSKSVAEILMDEYVEDIQRYYDGIKEPKTLEEAQAIARSNLGYFAGYYDLETRERVERLYGAVHPILGSTSQKPLTNDQIFRIGMEYGQSHGKSSSTLEEIRFNELAEMMVKDFDEGEE